jgi:hypothetical protein
MTEAVNIAMTMRIAFAMTVHVSMPRSELGLISAFSSKLMVDHLVHEIGPSFGVLLLGALKHANGTDMTAQKPDERPGPDIL